MTTRTAATGLGLALLAACCLIPPAAALDPCFQLTPAYWDLKADGAGVAEWPPGSVILQAPGGAAATARVIAKTPVTGNFQFQIGFELMDWQIQPGQYAATGIGVIAPDAYMGVGRGLTGEDDLYHAGIFRGGTWDLRAGGKAQRRDGQFKLTRVGRQVCVSYIAEPEDGGPCWRTLGEYDVPETQPLTVYLTVTNTTAGTAQFAPVKVRYFDGIAFPIKKVQVPTHYEPYTPPKPPVEPPKTGWVIYANAAGWLKVGPMAEYLAPQKARDEIGGGQSDAPLTKTLLHAGFTDREDALTNLCDYLTKVVVDYRPLAPPKEIVTAIYEDRPYKLRVDRGNDPDSVLAKAEEYDFAGEKAVLVAHGLTPRAGYRKQWIVHATGHGTTQGPVADDNWMLLTSCPTPDPKGGPGGFFLIADGYGGTFTYSCDKWEGPYRDNYGLGKAMKRLKIDTLDIWPPGANNYNRQVLVNDIPDQPTDYGPEVLGIQPIVDPAEMREWVVYTVGDTYLHIGTRQEFETPVKGREIPNFGTGENIVPKQELQLGGKSYSYICALEDLCRLLQKPLFGFHPLSEPRETVEADVKGKHVIVQVARDPDTLVAGYGGYNAGAEVKALAERGLLVKKMFKPQWLVHSTGHGTMNGPVKDDFWMMVGGAPQNGTIQIPDGMGGTFTHSVDGVGGPFTDNVALANALKARGLKSIKLYAEDRSVSVEEALDIKPPPAPKPPQMISVAPATGEPGTSFYITVITANTRPCHRFKFGPDIVVTDETCLGRDPDDANRERWLATVTIPPTVKVGASYPGTIVHPCTRSPLPPSPPGPPLVVQEGPKKPPLVIIVDIDGTRQDILYDMLCKGQLPGLAKLVGKPVTSNAAALTSYEAHDSLDPKSRIEFDNGIGLLNSTAVFPSYTFCAQASIFTGKPPCETGIPGNQFFDRTECYQYSFTGDEWGPKAMTPGDVLTGYARGVANKALKCDTLYDRLPPATKFKVIYNMYYGNHANNWQHYWHIGHDPATCGQWAEWKNILAQYGLYFYEPTTPVYDRMMAHCGTDVLNEWIAAAKVGGKVVRKEPWVLTLYFAGVDHWAHAFGINKEAEYLTNTVDDELDDVAALLKKEGLLEETVWVVTADHGETNVNGVDQPMVRPGTPKGFALTQRYSHNFFRSAPGGDLSHLCYANLGYTPMNSLYVHEVENTALVLSVNGGLGYVNVSAGLQAPPPATVGNWLGSWFTSAPTLAPGDQWRANPSEADVIRIATAVARANRDGVTAPASEAAGVIQTTVTGDAVDLLPRPTGMGPTLKGCLDLILMRKPSGPGEARNPYEVFSLDANDFPVREDLFTFMHSAAGQALVTKWGWRKDDAAMLLERRIQQTNCTRSGDLLLIPDYPRYYFETGKLPGTEHGSLWATDLYVPFLVMQVPPQDKSQAADRKRQRTELLKTMTGSFGDPAFPSNMDTARLVVNLCKAWKPGAAAAAGGAAGVGGTVVPKASAADAGAGNPAAGTALPTATNPPAGANQAPAMAGSPPLEGKVGDGGMLITKTLQAIVGNKLGADRTPAAPNAALPAGTAVVHLYVEMKEASPDGTVRITLYQGDRVNQKRLVQANKGDRFVISFAPKSVDALPAGKWAAVLTVGDKVIGTIPFTVGQ